jgi:hypothetical protein
MVEAHSATPFIGVRDAGKSEILIKQCGDSIGHDLWHQASFQTSIAMTIPKYELYESVLSL